MIIKLSSRIFLWSLLLSVLLLTGCIKEDLANCPTGLKIYFTYSPSTYAHTGVNDSEVDRIDLFVFDSQGIFRGVWIDEAPILSSEYFMTINYLSGDEYHFIAWCGLHGDYKTSPADFIIGQTTFNEALLRLEHNGRARNGVMPLFHAQKKKLVLNMGEQTIYMPLVQAYNTVKLTTEGLQESTDTYRMTIYDSNGTYYFDYSFAIDDEFSYNTICVKDDSGQLSASLNVLKLTADRNPIFEITNRTQGTTLYRENLVRLINETGNFDYEQIHTYNIHLKFGLDVSVSINGWWVVNDDEIGLN